MPIVWGTRDHGPSEKKYSLYIYIYIYGAPPLEYSGFWPEIDVSAMCIYIYMIMHDAYLHSPQFTWSALATRRSLCFVFLVPGPRGARPALRQLGGGWARAWLILRGGRCPLLVGIQRPRLEGTPPGFNQKFGYMNSGINSV